MLAHEKTILITGAAGFIGSNMLAYLFDKYPKYNFIVLDALTYAGDIHNISKKIHEAPNFRFVYGDVKNAKLVEELVSRANIVIHFAAETHVARSIYDDERFFETDVIGTQRVANAVLKHKKNIDRFIHISTSEVYGTSAADFMNENHPLNPMSPYAAAKAGADRLVYSYVATFDIPAVIIRPFNIFGPHQHLEKLIPRFITACLLKEPLTIHGSGNSSRDFTYVEDLVRAIDLVLHAPIDKVKGQVFNVGSGKNFSVNEIAVKIVDKMSRLQDFNFSDSVMNIGDRPGQVFRHMADATKIKTVLGWQPQISFVDGLEKTIKWYTENNKWWEEKLWMRYVPIETGEGKMEMH
ncbi:MAG: GDP-mannose 4,6-dehydratase [Patescibacteria group bacterium]